MLQDKGLDSPVPNSPLSLSCGRENIQLIIEMQSPVCSLILTNSLRRGEVCLDQHTAEEKHFTECED